MNLRRFLWKTTLISDKKRIEWFPRILGSVLRYGGFSPLATKKTLPHSWIATNIGGSLFGGFQACLADPIAAMACAKIFPDYRVWTRSLNLDFRAQGLSDLELRFQFTEEIEQQIRADLASKGRSTPLFEYGYYLADGTLCTLIQTRVAIRPTAYKPGK
ncbi:MAG: PaaI family thioesterase [Candidatus Methanofishera endochildressiae]|uniref:PaaI family thioesterase n=1 Tax=Candidatus Methanofishera endochildressiae TaxID=2738884 RepID=A0A7Z0SCV7_9GAMM|nr:PaaI family thioesterase [Candidatus Methanofishera endochildressiae]